MKNILFISVLFVSLFGFSQEYTIHRAMANGLNVKVQGNVIITDSIIKFDYKKSKDLVYYVVKENQSTFKTDLNRPENDLDIRFRIQETGVYKKAPYQLTLDAVDTFTNQVTQVIYFLRKED